MVALVFGLLGLSLGPFLHSLAVAVGRDQPPEWAWQCPRGVEHRGSPIRCSCGRWRWRELAVGIVNGAGFFGMTYTFGVSLVSVAHLAMVALTAMLVVTDFDHFRIPNRLLYPGGLLCAALLALAALLEDQPAQLLGAVGGGVAYFTLLLLVYVAARGEGFGFGDVKLSLLLGFFAGFGGWRVLAYSLFITSLLGGIPALILLALGRSRHTPIPYGPPLIFGAWAAIIWAQSFLS